MRSFIPRWRSWFSRYSTFLRFFSHLIIHPDAIPLTAFCTPNSLNEWLRMAQGTADVPVCFVCVMLLVPAALDMFQISLEDAIGSEDSPINYVADLAAFLARLRPHKKSELSPHKTQSEPREYNSWATSSLKMLFVFTMTKTPPCLACLCLRTSSSSAAFLVVLVTTSSPCLTWPGAYTRLRPYSTHNRKRRLRSPSGARSPIVS